jgi:ankyrin repeat protein
VKQLNIRILTAIALALAAAPAAAQTNANAGYDLVDAVRKGDGSKLTQLIRSHPTGLVDARDADGDTSLNVAIALGNQEFTAWLLNEDADPNLPGKGGDTPLITAARTGFDDAVEWLLAKGARVDGANRMGETPLIVAVQRRETAIVRLLLSSGANPDKTDAAQGFSARDYATRDPRARDILKLIQDKKPKASAAR